MRPGPRRVLRAARLLLLFGIAVTAGLHLRSCDRLRIPSADQSMHPTYPGGSAVLVERLAADAPLARGEDVVYTMEVRGTTYARFGRVRAVAGDEVGARDGRLTVNGELVGPAPIPGEAMGRVPEGTLLILAINPLETIYKDSRALGFIPRDRVVGRIRARLP